MNSGKRLSPLFPRLRHASRIACIVAGQAQDASLCLRVKFLRPLSMCCEPASNGKPCRASSAVRALFTNVFCNGRRQASSLGSGGRGWRSMMECTALPGNGKAWMAPWARLRWPVNVSARTRPIGGKNGRKRSLLVDGNGIPLSLVAAGANRHDAKLLEPTLDCLVVERPDPGKVRQHLCADAGYKGKGCLEVIRARQYEAQVKQRREESLDKIKMPGFRARRWVVERTHSWLNRWRKLLVSFEKTEAAYHGLLSLAASLICWRQTISIYG